MFSDLPFPDLTIVILSIMFSMGVHEAMHAFVAHWLGDTTAKDMGRLTLNPLKHIDIFTTVLLPVVLIALHLQPIFIAKPVPLNPDRVKFGEYGAALIGIAGPLTNFVLAGVASLLLRFTGAGNSSGAITVLTLFTEVNVGFFVFNMIPFPPLDGSRLLYAFAPEPLQRIMYRIESAGFMTIIVFILLLFPIISPAIVSVDTHILQFLLG
jgi:Zn-dependent protease